MENNNQLNEQLDEVVNEEEKLNNEEVESVSLETNELEEVVEEKQEEPYVGKQVTTSIKYDFRTMKYFNMYNTVVKRKMPIWYLVMALIALAFAAYTIVTGVLESINNPEVPYTMSLILGGVFVILAIYLGMQGFKFENLIDKTIANHFMTHKVAQQHIQIREDIITLIPVNKPEESFSYDWIQVTSIEEIDQFFFLYLGKSPLIIDKDPNAMVEGTYEEMLEIFREKAALKPYKKCDKRICKNPITFVHKEDLEMQEQALEVEHTEVEEEKTEE